MHVRNIKSGIIFNLYIMYYIDIIILFDLLMRTSSRYAIKIVTLGPGTFYMGHYSG